MSPQLKRAHRLGLELEEVGETDLDGRIVLRHRTVDSLGKLLRSGAVTEAMHDAGRAFQRDFRFAGLDPIRARPMDVPLGGGRASDLTDRQLHARRRVRAAMEALGGIGSPGGSCLWHVLGCGCSVREWALRRGWSGQPLRQEQAQGILIAALGCWHAGRDKAKVWRPGANWARRVEMTKPCLEILRGHRRRSATATSPWRSMTARGMDTDDRRLSRRSPSGSGCCLRQHATQGRWCQRMVGVDDGVAGGGCG